jgi:predicted dehydrogenase
MSDMRVEDFRAGVVGPSGIGRLHIEAMREIGVEVVAVASSTPESARRIAGELDIPRSHATVAELATSADLDVIHVCSPHGLHAEHARLALAGGKHVVCEKPLALSSAPAAAMLAEARAAQRLHAVAYPYRFDRLVSELRSIVQSGELGRIHLVRGSFLLDQHLLTDPAHWMMDPWQRGPSLSLADIGTHWWDLLTHVLGERITEAWCAVASSDGSNASDESAAIAFRLEGGALAQAAVSSIAPGHRDDAGGFVDMEVIGTQASVAWRQGSRDGLWFAALGGPGASRRPDLVDDEGAAMGFTHAYRRAFHRMIAAIYAGFAASSTTGYPTFEDGLRGLQVLDALLESASKSTWTVVAAP